MLLEPLPGASLTSIQAIAREVAAELFNARGTLGAPRDRYAKYISWANICVRKLANVATAESLDRLVLTRRYWLLQSIADQSDTSSVSDLLDVELAERVKAFDVVQQELTDAVARWSRAGRCVLPDTSFYIHHPDKLEELELAPLLKIWEEPIRILIPILVIDELDGLKRSGQKDARWRAGYTLAVVDRLLPSPSSLGVLKHEDLEPLKQGGFPRGEVTVEVVMDPLGHTRLPIDDDEIIDRALSIQALANRPVTMLTYDTGQAFRARNVRLEAIKLSASTLPGS